MHVWIRGCIDLPAGQAMDTGNAPTYTSHPEDYRSHPADHQVRKIFVFENWTSIWQCFLPMFIEYFSAFIQNKEHKIVTKKL